MKHAMIVMRDFLAAFAVRRGEALVVTLVLVILVALLAACGGDGTEPIPRDPINLSGTFAAVTLDGDTLPLIADRIRACGEQFGPVRIAAVEVTFYDDNPDPSASEGVARSVTYEYGSCSQRLLTWGTYRARTDSILFTWHDSPPAVSDAEWDTSARTSFSAMVALVEGEYLAVMRR